MFGLSYRMYNFDEFERVLREEGEWTSSPHKEHLVGKIKLFSVTDSASCPTQKDKREL